MKRRLPLLTTVGFLTVLFFFTVFFWVAPDRSFSEQENRSLSMLPAFSARSLFSGEYTEQINDYFADQFPLRDFLVFQKTRIELLLGKGENNGILLGEGGALARRLSDVLCAEGTVMPDCDFYDVDHVDRSLEALTNVSSRLDVPFTVLLTGRNIDVSDAAFSYPTDFSDRLYQQIERVLGEDCLTLKVRSHLRSCFAAGEEVYYRTDHHWTTLGAYRVYCDLLASFGMADEILSEAEFDKVVVSNRFLGTLWSAVGGYPVEPDTIEIWRSDRSSEYEIFADGKELDDFYNLAFLGKKDQYSLFLDGTHDVVTISKKGEADRPRLLLFKDSFANSLAPFLAEHFDLVLLNLSSSRRDFFDVSKLALEYEADRVLLLYTVENMITADRLCRMF